MKKILNHPTIKIIGFIASIITIVAIFFSSNNKLVVNNSNLNMSPIIQGEDISVRYEINNKRTIPLKRQLIADIDPIATQQLDSTLRGLKNIEYILPGEKIAFIQNLLLDEKNIIAYANEDCSEILVTEKFSGIDYDQNDICYTINVDCKGVSTKINGNKLINNPEFCIIR